MQGFDAQGLKGMPLARPLVGMNLMTDDGRVVGKVTDLRFDPDTRAAALRVEGTSNLLQRLIHQGSTLPASAMQAYGQDALVLSDAAAKQHLGER
jgi:sporulation protein YlmC with PRC-barrel domain